MTVAVAEAEDLAECARRLEASGEFVLLRRFRPVERYHEHDGCETRVGLVVDVETTGTEEDDPIIQFAMTKFRFGTSCGRVFEVMGSWSWYEDPGRPIPPEITQLTGITDEMVRGQRIDDVAVAEIAADAALCIAHNAGFDRPKVEDRLPQFESKHWACSLSELDWGGEGFASTKQEYLAYRLGFFYGAHRAEDDCLALLHILAQPLPRSGRLALAALLERARERTARVWALGSAFEYKDVLKRRGYRWSPGDRGRIKAWYRDMPASELEAELDWLATEVHCETARYVTMSAKTRHSERAFLI